MLAICPSSHRREDFLPESVVSWNLSRVSFLLSLFLLSQFPAQWASCHFPCTGFSLCSASTVEALTELGFCCTWPLTCGGQAEIVSARLNPSLGTIYVGGVCNFLGSVLLQQKFEVGDGPVLLLSFIGKQRKTQPQGMTVGQSKRHEEKALVQFWLLFYYVFFSPLPEPALCKLGVFSFACQ